MVLWTGNELTLIHRTMENGVSHFLFPHSIIGGLGVHCLPFPIIYDAFLLSTPSLLDHTYSIHPQNLLFIKSNYIIRQYHFSRFIIISFHPNENLPESQSFTNFHPNETRVIGQLVGVRMIIRNSCKGLRNRLTWPQTRNYQVSSHPLSSLSQTGKIHFLNLKMRNKRPVRGFRSGLLTELGISSPWANQSLRWECGLRRYVTPCTWTWPTRPHAPLPK